MDKDRAILLQHLQPIILHTHQYRVCILYKPDPELYIADWLSQNNHEENTDKEMQSLIINFNAIEAAVDLPVCTSTHNVQEVTARDVHLQGLKTSRLKGWLHKKRRCDSGHTKILAHQA